MLRFGPLAALGLLVLFNSCERHHPGEFPELQREHTHPLEAAAAERKAVAPTPNPLATPANFFPKSSP